MAMFSSRPPRPEDPLEGFAIARTVDFFALDRRAQDRFVASCAGDFDPRPLAADRGRAAGGGYRFVSIACAVGLLVLVVVQVGSLGGGLAAHGIAFWPAYAALVFGAVFGVNRALAALLAERALPFRPGLYLFSACVLDARTRYVRAYPTTDGSVVAQGNALRITADGRTFEFPGAATKLEQVQEAVARVPVAMQRRNASDLALLDPLYEPPFPSPIGPEAPYQLKLPSWVQKPWLTSGVVGVVVGGLLLLGRNHVSDGMRFHAAQQANDVASWRAYLQGGKRFAPEVKTVLLPRAELAEALKQKGAAPLVAFREQRADSAIVKEIDAELRAALLVELEEAKKPGTLAALVEFEKRLPTALVATELADAKHAVYARALAKAKSGTTDKKAQAVLDRLFAYIEKHGDKIEVRFRRKDAKNFERADQLVEKSATYAGQISKPSRYFDAPHQVKRESALATALVEPLDKMLAPELVQVERGANIDGEARANVPTFVITHGSDWSGHMYNSRNPLGTFVGIQYSFEVALVVPDGGEIYTLKVDTFRQAAMDELKPNERGGEEHMYEFMNADAAQTFKKRLFSALFGKRES